MPISISPIQITLQSVLTTDTSAQEISNHLQRMEETTVRIRRSFSEEKFVVWPYCELIAEVVNFRDVELMNTHLQGLPNIRFDMMVICDGYYCKLLMRWFGIDSQNAKIAVSGEHRCLIQWQMKG